MGQVAHAQFSQAFRVPLRAEVGNEELSTWFKDTHGLVDRLLATCGIGDIVDRQTGEHHIKRVVGERELPHVCCVQFDPLRDAFQFSIALRDQASVSRLVDGPPQIDSQSLASRKEAGSHEEHGTAATSEIEDLLIAM